jgi:hypothetical protein
MYRPVNHLDDCNLNHEDIRMICENLVINNKCLKNLSLNLNFKSNKQLENLPGTVAIARVMKTCALEKLSVVGDKPNRRLCLTGGEIRPIIQTLGKANKVQSISF